MTIAACYVSTEGIILGADSTSTLSVVNPAGTDGGLHHLNHAQKIFEVGELGTLGVAMWGMGSISNKSHRTLIAEFGDLIRLTPPTSVAHAAEAFANHVWGLYETAFRPQLQRTQELLALGEQARTEEQNIELFSLTQNLSCGFCLGGRVAGSRDCAAYTISLAPHLTRPPNQEPLQTGVSYFWGCPNFIQRILYGSDYQLFHSILNSGKWSGSQDELLKLLMAQIIGQPHDLPLREAVDWVHTVIYTTIKAMKFSHHLPVCGGPIEIAMISSDRPFRWVRHKTLGAALES